MRETLFVLNDHTQQINGEKEEEKNIVESKCILFGIQPPEQNSKPPSFSKSSKNTKENKPEECNNQEYDVPELSPRDSDRPPDLKTLGDKSKNHHEREMITKKLDDLFFALYKDHETADCLSEEIKKGASCETPFAFL